MAPGDVVAAATHDIVAMPNAPAFSPASLASVTAWRPLSRAV